MLTHVVYINGNFKLNAVSIDVLQIQRVDGSIFHDALELSFNSFDKASTLKLTNIDISQSINNNPVDVNVYSESEIHVGLSLKSYKHTNY